jgi:hypothetical protein
LTFFRDSFFFNAKSSQATLQVVLEEVPAEMQTRIAIINEEATWLASEDTTSPGEKMLKKRAML